MTAESIGSYAVVDDDGDCDRHQERHQQKRKQNAETIDPDKYETSTLTSRLASTSNADESSTCISSTRPLSPTLCMSSSTLRSAGGLPFGRAGSLRQNSIQRTMGQRSEFDFDHDHNRKAAENQVRYINYHQQQQQQQEQQHYHLESQSLQNQQLEESMITHRRHRRRDRQWQRSKRRRLTPPPSNKKNKCSVLYCGLIGGIISACLLWTINFWDPTALHRLTIIVVGDGKSSFLHHTASGRRQQIAGNGIYSTQYRIDQLRRAGAHNIRQFNDGIQYYLDLFQDFRRNRTLHERQQKDTKITIDESTNVLLQPESLSERRLATTLPFPSTFSSSSSSSTTMSSSSSSSSSSSYGSSSSSASGTSPRKNSDSFKDAQLVIAGKMSVEDAPCNIAEYNLKLNAWSLDERIQLSLYNSYSGGEVYMLLANHTNTKIGLDEQHDDTTKSRTAPSSQPIQGSGELIVVGAFDTTYRNSQVTYCSVGMWDGQLLSKVGEGLCNSALSKGMKITTAALAGPQDVYVAGSFQTQVWNGDLHEFVKIYNIAHYNAVDQVWMPLNIGQITCSWCTVTVLALAWDSNRRQLHVAGKFNAIDGRNVPAGLAVYDMDSGHLVAHPGGGLSMSNATQDGVGTALQLDEESGVLYVMGSFERLTATGEVCYGLAAYEINTNRWTCLADPAHTVQPTGGGNMLLTPYGLMVAGKVSGKTTWLDDSRPYTIALLKATLKTHEVKQSTVDDEFFIADDDQEYRSKETKAPSSFGTNNTKSDFMTKKETYHEFDWSWLPGFDGHDEPLHALSNGFGDHTGAVFIAGDNLVAKWSYQQHTGNDKETGHDHRKLYQSTGTTSTVNQPRWVAVTENLSGDSVRGAIMAISQMMPESEVPKATPASNKVNITIVVYCVAAGCVIGMLIAILWNRNFSSSVFPCFGDDKELKGISLDTLTYSALENTNITDAYQRAMKTRYVQHPHLLTIIDPQEIFLQRIIGEGTFGRVWSAKWRSASVAVKEFVFAQAAVAGKSSMQQEIVEEIIGEAGMMAILRHPNVLQLFGCSLTAQAIWIVSELCSLGSLRQVLDDNERSLPVQVRINLALQVAEGMTYLHNQDPPIIHRDLKSHNIFVHETFTDTIEADDPTKNTIDEVGGSRHTPWWKPQKMTTHSTLVAKIGDWGSARATLSGSRTMTHGVGTACWLAPEVIKHARSSKYSDVYGYGIILWELSTREEVYQGLETTQIIAKVANESLRPPVPQDCPWKDVMVRCWAENPQDRPEFSEIVVSLNKDQNAIENHLVSSTNNEKKHDDVTGGDDQHEMDNEDIGTEEETPETSPLLGGHSSLSPPTGSTSSSISDPPTTKRTSARIISGTTTTNVPANAVDDTATQSTMTTNNGMPGVDTDSPAKKRGFFSSVLRNARGD